MRTFWGLVLGLLLFFPGITLLQWLTRALGLYQGMSLTEGCLVMLLILATIYVVQHWPARERVARERRPSEVSRAAGSSVRSYRTARGQDQRRRRPRDFE